MQTLEHKPDLRIKFASMGNDGRHIPDSREEYAYFLEDLPVAWQREVRSCQIHTSSEGPKRAWALASRETTVGVVEHETGVEVLIAGVAVNLVSSAIYDLLKCLAKRWQTRRQSLAAEGVAKAPTFVEVGKATRDAKGQLLGMNVVRRRHAV